MIAFEKAHCILTVNDASILGYQFDCKVCNANSK